MMKLHWPLLNLSLMFLIPVVAAAYILLYADKFNLHQVNHGKLIDPPQSININAINKWQLVYVAPENCDLECQQTQNRLQKLHLALGANQSRVALTFLPKLQINSPINANSIFILDPKGLYIMHYDATANHAGILKDLRRLLKYSHAK